MLDVFANDAFRFFLLLNCVLAVGMAVVYASGQLSVGQAGFLAIGAYAGSWVDVALGWPLLPALLAGGLAAALVAVPVAVGANRVRGIALVMGTLAVGEVVRVGISAIKPVGGIQGYSGMQPASTTEMALALVASLVAAGLLLASPLGLAMRSIFDDEDAAAAAGVPTRQVKVFAVVASAAITGAAGVLYARYLSFIRPDLFNLELSFSIALYVLVGGVHSLLGALVGAFGITYLLEVLGRLDSLGFMPSALAGLASWRMVIYGGLVMVIMAWRPEGLVSRELAQRLLGPIESVWRRRPGRADATAVANLGPVPGRGLAASAGRVVLEVQHLGHQFGGVVALADMSFTLRAGEVVALLGANGAGKTTLINVVTGRFPTQTGTIHLDGHDVGRLPAYQRARRGLARTFQTIKVFGHLTAEENVRLGLQAHGGRDPRPLAWLLALADVPPRTLVSRLPLAGQRRVEIARAVASAPRALLLDEPSAGMNPDEREELADMIQRVRALGTAVVLVDHNVDLALGLADRAIVLDFGRVISQGSPAEVQADPRVRAAYLGTEAGSGTGGGDEQGTILASRATEGSR